MTLIEMTISIIVLSVLILASGGILVFLTRGQLEVTDDNDAQNRLELVRELMTNDFQTGSSIIFPSTIGGSGAVAGGVEVIVQAPHYNVSTDTSTNQRYRWNWVSNTSTLTRYVSSETAPGSGTYGSETTTLSQTGISAFTVTRFDDGSGISADDIRLDFTLSCSQNLQSAALAYTITLRNVR